MISAANAATNASHSPESKRSPAVMEGIDSNIILDQNLDDEGNEEDEDEGERGSMNGDRNDLVVVLSHDEGLRKGLLGLEREEEEEGESGDVIESRDRELHRDGDSVQYLYRDLDGLNIAFPSLSLPPGHPFPSPDSRATPTALIQLDEGNEEGERENNSSLDFPSFSNTVSSDSIPSPQSLPPLPPPPPPPPLMTSVYKPSNR